MRNTLLLESFSYLDEGLLERSETPARRAARKAWAGLAACLALVAALALPRFAATGTPSGAGQQSEAATTGVSEREWDAAYTPAAGETDEGDAATNGAAMLPEGAAPSRVITMVESYKLDADACYVPPKNGEVNRSMPLRAAMEEYGDGVRYRVAVDLFRDEQPLDWSGDVVRAESDRLGALGYIVAFEQVFDHEALQASYFTLHATRDQLADFPADGAYGYMLFLYAERAPERSADASVVVNAPALIPHGKPFDPVERAPEAIDGGEIVIDSAGTDAFAGETLTQEQAYADAELGAYLCAPPTGFGERDFVRANGVLSAIFLRGYDYVEWHVSRDAEADALDAADLTPELVAERMVRHADAGDTDGWRIMGFRVRYAGGVVVSVTAKGVTAEWLYEQLAALQ